MLRFARTILTSGALSLVALGLWASPSVAQNCYICSSGECVSNIDNNECNCDGASNCTGTGVGCVLSADCCGIGENCPGGPVVTWLEEVGPHNVSPVSPVNAVATFVYTASLDDRVYFMTETGQLLRPFQARCQGGPRLVRLAFAVS
jgi:hypothetical protein